MTASYVDRNDRSRDRLGTLSQALDDATTGQPGDGEWSVSTILGHLAFFDRLMLARWQAALTGGKQSPGGLPDGMADLVNAAGPEGWGALPAPAAGVDALRAATQIDAFLAGVDPAVAATAIAEDRAAVVDRSIHRNQHLDEIDRLLGRER